MVSGAAAPATRRWRYRASDAAGREAHGEVAADSADAAVAALQARALWVIDLEPLGGRQTGAAASGAARQPLGSWWARTTGRDLEMLAVLTRATATLLAAGVPLERALSQTADDDSDRAGAAAPWVTVFAALRERVRRGSALSDAARAVPGLPATFAPAFAAAEASGALAATFERLAGHLERQVRTRNAIRAALVYPTLLGVAALGGTLVILLVVVPRFAALLADSGLALPWATRLLVGAGVVLAGGGGWLLGGVVLLGVLTARALQSPAGRARWHARRLTLPLVGGLERDREAARYLDTLALALGNGVPILTALRLSRQAVHNVAMATTLEPVEPAVRDGAPLSQALGEWLPPLARRLLEAGESAGALAPMAQRAADAADAAVQRRLAQLVAVLEPFLILVFGGVVGFVALALLQAIYGLNAGQL